MKPCRYCAEQIQDAAIACPHCHRDQRSFWGQLTLFTKLWIILFVVLIVLPVGCAVFG